MPDRALDELLDQAIDALLAGAAPRMSGRELDPLARIAQALRGMPEEHFESRLKADLERRTSMSVNTAGPAIEAAATPVREGFRALTPFIIVPEGARLVEFLKHTFGAEEVTHTSAPGGFHAKIRIGDSMLMILTGDALRHGERRGAFHIYVPDTDAAFHRALEAGATSMGEPADRPYGERSGFVKDVAGNLWYIATRFANNVAPEGLGTVVPFVHPRKVRPFIDFAERAFGAQRMDIFEDSAGRVMHAAIRIGGGVLEMGEAHDKWQELPSMFVLHVDDCDAAFKRAIAAGATSLREPSDQPDGRRSAMLQDPFGYLWHPSSPLKSPAS